MSEDHQVGHRAPVPLLPRGQRGLPAPDGRLDAGGHLGGRGLGVDAGLGRVLGLRLLGGGGVLPGGLLGDGGLLARCLAREGPGGRGVGRRGRLQGLGGVHLVEELVHLVFQGASGQFEPAVVLGDDRLVGRLLPLAEGPKPQRAGAEEDESARRGERQLRTPPPTHVAARGAPAGTAGFRCGGRLPCLRFT
ncbi:hypothetical protein D7294_30160 [Streptomyces hoynatensis]|uniref:Uncharacterized protein n=1 Tax=Streptomyces hoynatensis TaxID=1141874 RepID=A0A3A9YN53_9ACTN|nr:hypothetical protein D7294_30160 [Streptomyces hoynatensis]